MVEDPFKTVEEQLLEQAVQQGQGSSQTEAELRRLQEARSGTSREGREARVAQRKAAEERARREGERIAAQTALANTALANIGGGLPGTSVRDSTRITGQLTDDDTTVQITPELLAGRPGKTTPFVVTQEERKMIESRGGTTLPIFTLQAKTPSEIDIEAPFLSGLDVSAIDTQFITRGEFESNIQQIRFAEEGAGISLGVSREVKKIKKEFKTDPESFIGRKGVDVLETEGSKTITLTEGFFKDLPSFKRAEKFGEKFTPGGVLTEQASKESLLGAKKEFASLGRGQRVKASASEFRTGLLKTGIGFAEGTIELAASLGTRTMTKEELKETSFTDRLFGTGLDVSLGKGARKIQATPQVQSSVAFTEKPLIFVGEAILERPSTTIPIAVGATVGIGLGVGALKNVRALGFKTGAAESLKIFSPLRIKGTTFAPKITKDTRFVGKTVEVIKDGKTISAFRGQEVGFKDIKLNIDQVSFAKGGVARTRLTTPEFQYLGGKLTQGVRTTEFATLFEGKPVGEFGFRGTSFTIPRGTAFAQPGFDEGIVGEFTKFAARKPVVQEFAGLSQTSPKFKNLFRFTGGERVSGFERTDPFFAEFKSVSGFRPQVSGIGLRTTAPSKPGVSEFRVIKGGGTKTPLSSTFGQQAKIITQPPKPIISGVVDITPVTLTPATAFSRGALFPPFQRTIQDTKTGVKIIQQEAPRLDTKQLAARIQAPRVIQRPTTRFASATAITPVQAQVQRQGQIERTRLRTTQQQIQVPQAITARGLFTSQAKTIGGGGIIIPPFIPRPFFRQRRAGTQISKQPTQFQSSLTSNVFGITATSRPILAGSFSLRPIIVKKKKKKKR